MNNSSNIFNLWFLLYNCSMRLGKKFFRETGYFLQEIARSKIILQAILVGLISGLLVVLFKVCINKLFALIQNYISQFDLIHKLFIFPIITTFGGLISGILVYKFAPETKGSGIPFVKMVMARMGNITRVRSIVVKFIAGVAGIGTGLSLGREGPSVQLGAGAGALVGKMFKMLGTDQGKLIASGAGSAIGATFNAPIAGTIFVLEELVNKFSASLLFPVLVATVTASSVARYFLGNNPSFTIPYITHDLSFEGISVCIILGIVAGFLGVAFAKVIYKNNELFEKMDVVPNWLKPAVAGFVIGVVGIFIPYVLGSGNLSVDLLLQHKLSLSIVLLVFVVKFFITPFCFGSGAVGGIFLPMLMLGSFLGYIVASVFNFQNAIAYSKYSISDYQNIVKDEYVPNLIGASNAPYIMHYICIKPWDDIDLVNGEFFWKYARKSPYYETIYLSLLKNNFSKIKRKNKKKIFSLQKIFSIRNEYKNNQKYKILTICGIKLMFKIEK